MNWDRIGLLLIFIISTGYLLFISVRGCIRLYWFKNKKYEVFQQWLIDKRGTNYPHMSEESLEGKIVSMLEWWDSRKNPTKTGSL